MLGQHKDENSSVFSKAEKIVAWACEIMLYSLQVITLIFALITMKRLKNLSGAKPICTKGICNDETEDSELCQECNTFVKVLANRLPTIQKGFVLCLSLFIFNFVMYMSQRFVNLIHKDA